MIPVNEPRLDGNEEKYLRECIQTGWVSSDGPFVSRFEREFGDYLGLPQGAAVCNGTAALEAALYGLEIGEGDEVILPSFTIISCALAIIRLGATPVLVDIDAETWCMDVTVVADEITQKTKAVMAVHIYGHPVDIDPLRDICDLHGLSLIEDAAEVHGAEYMSSRDDRWLKCGAIGDVSIFSFYANKIITTGEGGIVMSRNERILERSRLYRNLCFISGNRFYHEDLGANFRMTNLQAAVGVAQLERIEELVRIKRINGAKYKERLAEIPGVRFQPEKSWARSVHWMYAIEISSDVGCEADEVRTLLGQKKIGSRPFFMGLHAQPALRNLGLFDRETYPRTDHAARYGLYLPSGLTLTEAQIDEVCSSLVEIMDSF